MPPSLSLSCVCQNHGVILADADHDHAVNALVGSAFGAAGQRCMALSTAIFVGDSSRWIEDVKERAAKLKVGAGHKADTDVGPVISADSLQRIHSLLASAEAEGARIVLDGRSVAPPADSPHGNFLGPTIVADVNTDMRIYREEVFGPVLVCLNAHSLADAIKLVNSNPYGNGTAIFTTSGAHARQFQYEIDVGQVGINVSAIQTINSPHHTTLQPHWLHTTATLGVLMVRCCPPVSRPSLSLLSALSSLRCLACAVCCCVVVLRFPFPCLSPSFLSLAVAAVSEAVLTSTASRASTSSLKPRQSPATGMSERERRQLSTPQCRCSDR